ncbi:MAG: phosphate ABC transporter substrate-binding protein PstS, partial [Lapillicoccus sp.]
STAQLKAIQQAISLYQAACDNKVTINYSGTGSGAGVKQFTAKQVQFGGSDSALKTVAVAGASATELDAATAACGSPALDIPLAAGAIGAAYHLEGVDKLNLDSATLAKIYTGKITKWNDAAIGATNSGVTLPDKDIKVFFRSDESGTTENLAKYLHATAPDVWTFDPAKAWKGTGEGKKGSSEIAKSVVGTDGSIGYMEVAFATEAKLKVASIGGLAPEGDALAKGVAGGKIAAKDGDVRITFDYTKPAEGAYPIPIVTYELVCSKYADATVGKTVKSFLGFWAKDATQQAIAPLGYVPLPAELKTAVDAAIAGIS